MLLVRAAPHPSAPAPHCSPRYRATPPSKGGAVGEGDCGGCGDWGEGRWRQGRINSGSRRDGQIAAEGGGEMGGGEKKEVGVVSGE